MSAGSTHGIAGAAGARGGTVSALGTVVFPEAETSTGGPASRDVGAVQHSVQHGAHALPRRTHAALLRPVLYAGVERTVIALESTIAIGLVATVGPRLVTLEGDLILKGHGDPKITIEQWAIFMALLRGQKLDTITGDLVLDRSIFAPPMHSLPVTRQPGMRSFRRLIERRNVLLPQPLGPIIATTWLRGMPSETDLIAS